jgi:hypothetical protein
MNEGANTNRPAAVSGLYLRFRSSLHAAFGGQSNGLGTSRSLWRDLRDLRGSRPKETPFASVSSFLL